LYVYWVVEFNNINFLHLLLREVAYHYCTKLIITMILRDSLEIKKFTLYIDPSLIRIILMTDLDGLCNPD
jgi:hypothetical protein